MKEIMAIIRQNMINKTKQALSAAGYPSMTCRKVLGRGKKKVSYLMIEEGMLDGGSDIGRMGEELSEIHRLIPKRMLNIVLNDEDVKRVVDILMEVNCTGSPGDGKIFVMPVYESYRVRTEESGEAVL